MSINGRIITQLAQDFITAEMQCRPIEPIISQFPHITEAEAYRIQKVVVDLKKERGEQIVGKKVGATSQAIQQFLGVEEPIYGQLFASQQLADGETISISQLIHPRVECEIAFLLDKDLIGPGVTETDVLEATRVVMPALEINDPRTRDWKIGMVEVIADNGVSARFILGEQQTSLDGVDLSTISVALKKNGEEVAKSTGAAVLGNPANAVAWLANKVSERQGKLQAGEIILPGSLTPIYPVEAGDRIEAEFEELGTVVVHIL